MKKFGKFMLTLSTLAVFSACVLACGGKDDGNNPDPIDYGYYTGINDKIVDFTRSDGRDKFSASSWYGNGGMFDCDWRGDNVVYDDREDVLRLKITKENDRIYGAEYKSNATYGYGYYSVRMKAIKREGVVSSFFTYTNRPKWDEIDIEFLGKDTTKVQFNYFTGGVGKHEKLISLGFDASEGFHEYGFKWEENKITWYVDGKGVYAATTNIPSANGQIMMNAWNGKSEGDHNVKNWLGVFDKNTFPVPDAEYKWIGYRALDADSPETPPQTEYTVTFHKGEGSFATGESGIKKTQNGKVVPPTVTPPDGKKFTGWFTKATGGEKVDVEQKTFTSDAQLYAQYETIATQPDVPQSGWKDISVAGFNGWGNYTVDTSNGVSISHSQKPNDWATCGMELTAKYTYVKFTVKNNGTQSANVRVEIKNDGAQKGAVCEVVPAENYNDYDRGAVVKGLAVGASVDIVCKLDDGNSADRFAVMLNSFDGGAQSGSVTISGIMGILAEVAEPPETEYGSYTGVNDKIADFTYGACDDVLERADNWTNGGMFDCVWSANNVRHDGGTQSLHLSITDDNGTNRAGEFRTKQKFGYGYFSVNMKAIKRDGVVSSLFTYTGPTDGTEWHEIDIEILGNDTTKVQFNYYTNGVGGHEYLYDLGFDASEGFHEYAFKWEEDRITWYVDGVGVYSATKDIPSVPGKIMINAWTGKSEGEDNVVDWIGAFDRVFPVPDAEYKWIGYKQI